MLGVWSCVESNFLFRFVQVLTEPQDTAFIMCFGGVDV